MKKVFCWECSLKYARKRMIKWNKENNPKKWHRALVPKVENSVHYKGLCKRKDGYIRLTVEVHNRKLFHRVIMERVLGRELSKDEIVHHKDGNPSNNDISNLQLTNRFEHMALHK